jgi:hypothetical protein
MRSILDPEPPITARKLIRGALLALAIIGATQVALAFAPAGSCREPAPAATCTTDSECLKLCPADDEQCDGGPQS